MITRLCRNAIECAGQLKCNCRFLADRAFLSEEGLKLIEEYNAASEHVLHVVTKCRNTVIAFTDTVPQKGKRGRPSKRGKKSNSVSSSQTKEKSSRKRR